MNANTGPSSVVAMALQAGYFFQEAGSVVALRSAAFLNPQFGRPDEIARMLSEKPVAFHAAARAAWMEAVRGGRGDQVLCAALRPLRAAVRANAARLSRG